ncbi:MAG: dihydrodipicolinate synthase family protein [Sedimentisphaerales bacterium]|nr:dihydrodipicolinate synthase family protein [Sedimentisphaerales bacterium]
MNNDLHGVIAALPTPINDREQVDLECLERLVGHLIRQGVHGLVALGSTGEFYALTGRERQEVVMVTLRAANGAIPVLVGANGGSTEEVVHYCRQAERLGAQGLMLASPYYSCPTHQELLVHLQAANDAVGIPIMLYNCPARTGVDMTPEFIERAASLSNVRFVKESTGQMERITRLIRTCGERIVVFCGCDTIALEGLIMGAAGWVGGMVNVLPRMHRRLYDLVVQSGELAAARRLFYKILPVLEMAEQGGKYTQVVKTGCQIMGHPVGPPRRPLRPLDDHEYALLSRLLGPVRDAESVQ